jgi:hypothetical protein
MGPAGPVGAGWTAIGAAGGRSRFVSSLLSPLSFLLSPLSSLLSPLSSLASGEARSDRMDPEGEALQLGRKAGTGFGSSSPLLLLASSPLLLLSHSSRPA